jgi:hypothetical protein
MTDATRKGRRTLLLLALVFLGPMAVAMVLYFTGFQWRPEGSTENGLLYQPPRPLPALAMALAGEPDGSGTGLRGKWTLFYVGPGACAEDCRRSLAVMRQVRRALGRDMDRVQRLYLVTVGSVDTQFLQAEHPGIGIVADGAGVAEVGRIAGIVAPGDIFLADPLGNLVMRYPAGTSMKDLHADLKHLLKISTVG